MMWKVLLVEDELFVRESIREIIDWEQHQFILIGEAGDGKEALQLIESANPDLVITDIVMPEMDGLELLKTARARGYDCKFIMLTCLNEFHYAREALEYGASNYILKLSMSVKSLLETLLKVRKELEKSLQYNDYEISKYYSECWELLINKGLPAFKEPYRVPPVKEMCRNHVRLISILHGQSALSEAGNDPLRILLHPERCIVHTYTVYGLTTVFCWSAEPIPVAALTAENANNEVWMLVSGNHPGERMLELWSEMIGRVNEYWFNKRAASVQAPVVAGEFYWEEEAHFFQLFEQMKLDECRVMIDSLWDAMRKQGIGMVQAKQLAVETDKILSRQTRCQAEPADELNLTKDAEQLKRLIAARMERYMSFRIACSEKQTDHAEINKLKEYILKHYDSPITVKSMAVYVSLDETYLSNLFKQKTGETLIKYLHRIRVEKSKYYLEQTQLAVYEIADKVGFVNVNYYNRIFKRTEGITPSEYRTNYRSGKLNL